ncbi:hypothetical protein LINPERPRIM_LOCUS1080, partial [Linum perenne]
QNSFLSSLSSLAAAPSLSYFSILLHSSLFSRKSNTKTKKEPSLTSSMSRSMSPASELRLILRSEKNCRQAVYHRRRSASAVSLLGRSRVRRLFFSSRRRGMKSSLPSLCRLLLVPS